MFTKDELLANWRQHQQWTYPPLEVNEFWSRDFTSSSSEQSIVVARGLKAHVGDALRFWFGVGDVVNWYDQEPCFSRDIEAALCEPISEGNFHAVVAEYCISLVPPLPEYVREVSHWIAGLCLYREWNHVAVIVETLEAFLFFQWSTSA